MVPLEPPQCKEISPSILAFKSVESDLNCVSKQNNEVLILGYFSTDVMTMVAVKVEEAVEEVAVEVIAF